MPSILTTIPKSQPAPSVGAPMKAAAVYAREFGWRVMPDEAGGKRPILKNWPALASNDPKVIADWIASYPLANVGIATGSASGFWALDMDPGNGGDKTLAQLELLHGPLPITPTARTGSGGSHQLFQIPDFTVTNTAGKVGRGIDTRGDGGQIVAPPSRSAKGAYSWIRAPWNTPIAPAPAWLLELLRQRAPAARLATIAVTRGLFSPASLAVLSEAGRDLEALGPAIEGSGGDVHTWRACAMLRIDFALTEAEAWPLLLEWNGDCQPPWPETDLAAKMRGGATGSGVYGCKRKLDTLEAVTGMIRAWQEAGQVETKIPALIEAVNAQVKTGVDGPTRALIVRKLTEATGFSAREQNLARAVDLAAVAGREERKRALDAGGAGVIDSKDPLNTAKRFQAATADGEGMPEIARWQEEWWHARGTHYEVRPHETVNADLYKYTETKRDAETGAPAKPDRNMVETISHALRAVALVDTKSAPAWIQPAGGDPAPDELIAFRNGLLHVPSRAFIPATRRFFNLNAVAFPYDRAAPSPVLFLAFLEQLWPNDPESIGCLQEFAGLSLTGDTSFQKLVMLIGPKRSGKGTLARVLTELVGVANVTAPTLNGLGQHFGLESLIGKTLAVISDARLGGRTDLGAVVENLLRISGEDTISVPRKHRSDWTAKLSTRFLIISNELPGFLDQSGALASRFILLRLTESFYGNEDRALTQKLLGELPGILLWALAGLDRLRARGHFIQPASAGEMVRQLETLASPVKEFVSDRCTIAAGATVACSALFAAWQAWTFEQGREHAGSVQMFGRNLTAAFPALQLIRPRVNGERERHYAGLSLLGGP